MRNRPAVGLCLYSQAGPLTRTRQETGPPGLLLRRVLTALGSPPQHCSRCPSAQGAQRAQLPDTQCLLCRAWPKHFPNPERPRLEAEPDHLQVPGSVSHGRSQPAPVAASSPAPGPPPQWPTPLVACLTSKISPGSSLGTRLPGRGPRRGLWAAWAQRAVPPYVGWSGACARAVGQASRRELGARAPGNEAAEAGRACGDPPRTARGTGEGVADTSDPPGSGPAAHLQALRKQVGRPGGACGGGRAACWQRSSSAGRHRSATGPCTWAGLGPAAAGSVTFRPVLFCLFNRSGMHDRAQALCASAPGALPAAPCRGLGDRLHGPRRHPHKPRGAVSVRRGRQSRTDATPPGPRAGTRTPLHRVHPIRPPGSPAPCPRMTSRLRLALWCSSRACLGPETLNLNLLTPGPLLLGISAPRPGTPAGLGSLTPTADSPTGC